jgi:hypothetical protein
MYDWPMFRFSMSHRSLYILGAGASLPTIKPNADKIRKKVREIGIYEVSPQPTSLLKERLLPPDDPDDSAIALLETSAIPQNELDLYTPDAVVETLFAQMITKPGASRTAQYEVFDHFAASVIFNFNNDNLADEIHPRHLCLYPHGQVKVGLVHSKIVYEGIQRLSIPSSFINALDYHRPLPEQSGITSHSSYTQLASYFESVQAVIIIGYSFGEQQATGSIDDLESFEMIVDLLRWRPKRVLVVGPDPEQLFFRIEDAIKSKAVSMLLCKWNVLSAFILSGAFAKSCNQARCFDSQEITSLYRKFEDVMCDESTAFCSNAYR